MKRSLITAAVVVSSALIAPKFIGVIYDNEHEKIIDLMHNNPNFSITNHVVTNDWFTGKATTTFYVSSQSNDFEGFEFTVNEQIHYGPFIYSDKGLELGLARSNASFSLPEVFIEKQMMDIFNDKIELSSLMTFTKDFITDFSTKEFNHTQDGNQLVIKKSSGHFSFDDTQRMVGSLSWDGLTLKNKEADVVVGQASLDFDQSIISGDYYKGNALMAGDFSMKVDAINVSDANGMEQLAIDTLAFVAKAEVDNDAMDLSIVYHLDELTAVGKTFKNANLTLLISHLDTEIMQEINDKVASIPSDLSEEATNAQMMEVAKIAGKLLAKDPVIEIQDLSVETPDGKIVSDMQIVIDKNLFDANNIMSAMAAIKADAKGSAPEAFLVNQGLSPMIEAYIQQGLLVREDDKLSFKAQFQQGKLNVNGKVLPL